MQIDKSHYWRNSWQKLREALKRRKAKKACKELMRLTEEMGLYEWQQERSGSK
jgi:hypothetical protein